ncbi:MAG: hypothetical protein ACSHX3_16075 [Litorimonas sp.]
MKLLRYGVKTGYSYTSPKPSVLADAFARGPDACRWKIGERKSVIVLPSTCLRCDPQTHSKVLRNLLFQLKDNPEAGLVFALQGEDTNRLYSHLDEVAGTLGDESRRVLMCPIIGYGKTAALNAVFSLFDEVRPPEIVGWVDDDVVLGDGTLAAMIAATSGNNALQVVGAKKVPVAYEGCIARAFLQFKRLARPEGTLVWPHGCAMLVRYSLIAEGIPLRYRGEDGFIVLSAFAETKAAEDQAVKVLDGTMCEHVVGGPGIEIPARVIRTLFENSVLLADFPEAKSLMFARLAIFHGLYDPRAPLLARVLGSAHYLFYCLIGIYLVTCGMLGRPKRSIRWSGYSTHNVPNGTGGIESSRKN